MATPAKEQTVKELNEVFKNAKSAILTDSTGIDAPSITAFRAHLRERQILFKVLKNTLARRAAQNTSFEVLESDIQGPISVLVSYEDLLAPAKALAEYGKKEGKKKPKVLCGLIEGEKISPEEVKALSELPSREQLIAQLLATFQGPTTQFAGVFHSLLRNLVGTLDAVRQKKEKEGS